MSLNLSLLWQFEQGFSVLGLDYSPIQGGHGNIEFLAYLKKEEGASNQVAPEIEKSL